jgi:acetyl esterase/lipase
MASLKSNVYNILIRAIDAKHAISKEFQTGNFSKRDKAAEPSKEMKERYDIRQMPSENGRNTWWLNKKGFSPKSYILYLHGGAYVHNITIHHWKILDKILQNTAYGVVVPDYPLAPKYTYKDSFSMVVPVYEDLLKRAGSKNLVLMGDSSGGGFALALAQYATLNQIDQPAQIILLSPWLDVSMQNPEIKKIDKLDPYLGVDGLKQAGLAYAGPGNTANYQVSPINGPVESVAPISILIGSHDVLMPDARKLTALAGAKGVSINYVEYPKMNHVWLSLKIPEAKKGMNKILQLLKQKNT